MSSCFYNPGSDVLFPIPGTKTAEVIAEAMQTAVRLGREVKINYDMGVQNPRNIVTVGPRSTFEQILGALDEIERALTTESLQRARQEVLARTHSLQSATPTSHCGPLRHCGDTPGGYGHTGREDQIENVLWEVMELAVMHGRDITLYFDIRPQIPLYVTVSPRSSFVSVVDAYYKARLAYMLAWQDLHNQNTLADYRAMQQR